MTWAPRGVHTVIVGDGPRFAVVYDGAGHERGVTLLTKGRYLVGPYIPTVS